VIPVALGFFTATLMMKQRNRTFYRYRAFNTATLQSLCNDTLYFSPPGMFNDPLDCSPTVECDSTNDQLRGLLEGLIQRRVSAEILSSLKEGKLRGKKAAAHASKWAVAEAKRELADIAYHATNPDYAVSVDEAEGWLLTSEIEREILRYYERGVCCFSTTCTSPLLWSHYGDQHQGLCIGYGTDRIPKPTLHKVIYGGSRGIKTSMLARAFLDGSEDAKEELDRNVLLRKARGWNYEKEWRLIGSQGLQDSPLLLKEVVFGLRCEHSVIHAVVEALERRDKLVQFFEIYEVRDRYLLRRRSVNLDELSASYPKTAMSGDEMFGSNTSR
jgi:Protein of unknown function (DUF2971)